MTTPFVEANALLALQGGSRTDVHQLLADMYPHELRKLADAAYELADMCRAYEREKSQGGKQK